MINNCLSQHTVHFRVIQIKFIVQYLNGGVSSKQNATQLFLLITGLRECPNRSMSGRLFSLVCLMFGWLMMTSYSAALVSRLAVRRTDPPPYSSLAEAALKRTHVICTRVNDFAYTTLFQVKEFSKIFHEYRFWTKRKTIVKRSKRL